MTKKHITVQGVDEAIWRKFRGKCVLLDLTVGDRLNQLMAEDITSEATPKTRVYIKNR